MIGVYVIRHSASGGFYIGSTVNYIHRQRQHLSNLQQNTHENKNLQRLYSDSPGLTWEFTQCNDRESALLLEESMIRQHWGNPKLCNIAFGKSGWHAGTMPDEVRQKIADSQTGKKHSVETKALMSTQRRGKQKTTEWVNKIADSQRLQIKVGDVVYNGAVTAARALGISDVTVLNRARSTSKKFDDWSIVEKP